MKDPIQKYFQVGTIQWMTHPPVNYPILDSVKTICCDEYFNALEITHIEDQETKDKVRDMLAQSHMKVCYGAQPRLLGPKLNHGCKGNCLPGRKMGTGDKGPGICPAA